MGQWTILLGGSNNNSNTVLQWILRKQSRGDARWRHIVKEDFKSFGLSHRMHKFGTTHNCFMALFWDYMWASARRSLLLDFTVQREISEADTPAIWLGTTTSGLISNPPALSRHFLCRMSFLLQPSQFILSWARYQICWLAYPVAWIKWRNKIKNIWLTPYHWATVVKTGVYVWVCCILIY